MPEYHSIRRADAREQLQQSGTGLTLSVTVPVNATATVTIPTSHPAAVTERRRSCCNRRQA